MNLEGKSFKEALTIILDFLYNMLTDGDELFDEDVVEIINFCKKNNIETDFLSIDDLGDYIVPEDIEE